MLGQGRLQPVELRVVDVAHPHLLARGIKGVGVEANQPHAGENFVLVVEGGAVAVAKVLVQAGKVLQANGAIAGVSSNHVVVAGHHVGGKRQPLQAIDQPLVVHPFTVLGEVAGQQQKVEIEGF